MNFNKRSQLLYYVVAIGAWLIYRDLAHESLFFAGSYDHFWIPVVAFGLPNLLYFLFAGAVFGLLLEGSATKQTGVAISVFCALQIVLTVFFTRSIVYDWMGYLILSSPFLGIAVGFATGVFVSQVLRAAPRLKGSR